MEEWKEDRMEGARGKRDGESGGGGSLGGGGTVYFGAFRSRCYLMKMK